MRVCVFGEFSGRIREEFAKRGHDAWSCDVLPTEKPSRNHIQDDMFKHLEEGWDMGIFHPYCTDTAVSGARWFEQKQRDYRQQKAIVFFMRCYFAPIPKICVEHPISIMSTIFEPPTQIIQPWQYGHGETKATCLWLKNLPVLKPTNIVAERKARIHREPPGPNRWKNRSRTFQGIAEAMAEQWGSVYNVSQDGSQQVCGRGGVSNEEAE